MSSQAFGRERRVRRRADYQRILSGGRRAHGRFLTLIVAPNTERRPRLGMVASRKLGNAVKRNRAKRLIREMFRRTLPAGALDALDIVVIPRQVIFFQASLDDLHHDFRTALRRSVKPVPHGR